MALALAAQDFGIEVARGVILDKALDGSTIVRLPDSPHMVGMGLVVKDGHYTGELVIPGYNIGRSGEQFFALDKKQMEIAAGAAHSQTSFGPDALAKLANTVQPHYDRFDVNSSRGASRSTSTRDGVIEASSALTSNLPFLAPGSRR